MSQALRKLTGSISKTNCIVVFINQLREKIGIMYGEGISKAGELIDIGLELHLVQKPGSWFYMGEARIGQGREAEKTIIRVSIAYLHRCVLLHLFFLTPQQIYLLPPKPTLNQNPLSS
jgi:hypothetical protein